MPSLDSYLPHPLVREHFEHTVQAPAPLVMRTAYDYDMQSIGLIRTIIRTRKLFLRGTPDARRREPLGLVAETRALGWGTLHEEPGRQLLCGAVCQPWFGDVTFTAIPPDEFAGHAEPDQVKIAWSLEAWPKADNVTLFVHEVRALPTDEQARRKFLRYWRWARFGIVAIRLLLLPAIRRKAERDWAARGDRPSPSRRRQ